jgi:hypothetical protein
MPLREWGNRLVAIVSSRGRPGTRLRRATTASTFTIEYSPRADGRADPGEVVWTWVPYEDDPRQGKDRPVLVIGRHKRRLVALMLTSKDHDQDADRQASQGRHWIDIGPGSWDRQGRPSEVRLDRILDVDPNRVRREGGVLPQSTFDQVIVAFRGLRQG